MRGGWVSVLKGALPDLMPVCGCHPPDRFERRDGTGRGEARERATSRARARVRERPELVDLGLHGTGAMSAASMSA